MRYRFHHASLISCCRLCHREEMNFVIPNIFICFLDVIQNAYLFTLLGGRLLFRTRHHRTMPFGSKMTMLLISPYSRQKVDARYYANLWFQGPQRPHLSFFECRLCRITGWPLMPRLMISWCANTRFGVRRFRPTTDKRWGRRLYFIIFHCKSLSNMPLSAAIPFSLIWVFSAGYRWLIIRQLATYSICYRKLRYNIHALFILCALEVTVAYHA